MNINVGDKVCIYRIGKHRQLVGSGTVTRLTTSFAHVIGKGPNEELGVDTPFSEMFLLKADRMEIIKAN